MKLEERSALEWRFTDRNPHDNRADRAAAESSHSRLAHETVVTDGPYPLDELGAVASMCEVVVLVGRATRVP